MSYIPKVGEICHYRGVYKVKFLCMCDGYAVIKPVESSVVGTVKEVLLIELNPLKTPAEIEREKGVNEIVEIIVNFYGNPKGAESYKLLAEKLYVDEVYRKQQVKPLSRSGYVHLYSESGYMRDCKHALYDLLVSCGHIIQGGE